MARRIYITVAQLEARHADPAVIATFRRLYGERTQVTALKAAKVATQFGLNEWLWARCLFNLSAMRKMRFVKQRARYAYDTERAAAKTQAARDRADVRYCKAIAAGWAQAYVDMYAAAPASQVKASVNQIHRAMAAA